MFSFVERDNYTLEEFIEFDHDVFSCENATVTYEPITFYDVPCKPDEAPDIEDLSTHQNIVYTDKKAGIENNRVLLSCKLNDIENKYIIC